MLSTQDIYGGAARAAHRLLMGLLGIGLESQMLVQTRADDHSFILGPATKFQKAYALIRPHLDALPLRLYPKRRKFLFSPAVLPDKILSPMLVLDPDIIHLHWVAGGFLRIESLRRFRKPIVWTLHDMWAFTGGCHYSGACTRYRESCGMCQALGSNRQPDLSCWILKRKQRAWSDLNLTIVTPSSWLRDCVESSSLFRDVRVEWIPNGIDLERFRPLPSKVCRELLSMPEEKRLIAVGAMSALSDERKGFQFLAPALRELASRGLSKRAEVVVFGASEPSTPPDFGMKTHYLGHLHDDVSLALVYAACDVFVAPSTQDNLPNTVMESMACGTPCVAFDIGGMPDMIEHRVTGYLAQPYKVDDLAKGISWILEDQDRLRSMCWQVRQSVERKYSIWKISKMYQALYRNILNNTYNYRKIL